MKKQTWIGLGCVLLASSLTIFCIVKGKQKEDDHCGDDSPVGFYEEKNMPSFQIKEGEDYTYKAKENTVFHSILDVKNIEEKEDDFLIPYLEKQNKGKDEDTKMTLEGIKSSYRTYEEKNNDNAKWWPYIWAYTDYYALNKQLNLKSSEFNFIFDGVINCSSNKKTQLYLHEQNETYTYAPTFNFKKKGNQLSYFSFFAKSSTIAFEGEFTLSLLKKIDTEYARYNFVFNASIVSHRNLESKMYAAYFEDFEGFDSTLLEDISMMSLSYKIQTPEAYEQEEETFLKLYDFFLPESTWTK